MSVLLTAGRKRKDEKKIKKKKSEDPVPLVFAAIPKDLSPSASKVWRWVQQGGKTFVLLYCKHNQSVWCNGDFIETKPSSSDGGIVILFRVVNNDCRIETFRTGPKVNYRLLVNGNPIPDGEEMAMMGATNYQT